MRIAYVCADAGVPVFGCKGSSVHVQEMIRAFQRQGARVDLFAARVGERPPPDFDALSMHRLPAIRDGEPAGHAAAVTALNHEVAAAIERAGPYDLVYERYSLWSFAAMEQARAAGISGLLEVNAPLIEEQAVHRGLRDAGGAALVAARVFQAATALVAVSAEVAAWLARWPSAPGGGRVHVLHNGVAPERFRPDVRPASPGPPGTFTVGFVGSMKPWHGLSVLIEAFARLHHDDAATRLLLVGGGPEDAAIRAELAARGLTNAAVLTGVVAPGEVPGLLTSMDAAVAPYPDSKRFYFSPLKVYEYMAAGRAVVASRVGQLEAVIQHEINGLLCSPADPGALATALSRLRREPEFRDRLGRAARATVLQGHTWDAVAAKVLALATHDPVAA
ncbi:MAG: glycosyltransferase family 1 protein [Gemmatimonadetes bacterium]|nr:MAG: glycosyltransferase family 1 protein [Gemmatimonadota bacterium]PYO82840.1 MAG: glycosyltransferase family 1 protein [Gemmatimonadota bacterium]